VHYSRLYPNVANVGGLQFKGVKGEVVVLYFEPLTTQNLKSSGVPEGYITGQYRLYPSCPDVARRAKSDEFTGSGFQEILL